jgi:hypothetical protein
MKYILEYEWGKEDWRKSNVAPEKYDSLTELLRVVYETDKHDTTHAIIEDGNYRIRKVPEQPEEQVME